jgi:hypothetical protein
VNDELRSSTYFIEPGNYLKLRNLQVGYNLPKPWTARVGMDRFYIYLAAQNVLMIKSKAFTGPDPESPDGSSYSNPYVRPFVFKGGIEIGF